jgi:glutamate/tyrosine decarboxylase-like PLP-dependent enzyme
MCGIGLDGVREIPVDSNLSMRVDLLIEAVASDRAKGLVPFLICGTAGTTNAGVFDPLPDLAAIAEKQNVWFHVDAAWGGGAALVPEYRPVLNGIERANSITFDAHKFLSVPMGASLFLTRDRDILHRTFLVETAYMPNDAAHLEVTDPHAHSMQWSRRFIGLKLLLSLAVAGWSGYAKALRQQFRLGALLRAELTSRGWEIVNRTELPVVCFTKPGVDPAQTVARIVASGSAWISATIVGGSRPVLRACITNYRTSSEDVLALVDLLG